MRLRFWEPRDLPTVVNLRVVYLEPRRMNLSELAAFAQDMASAAGSTSYWLNNLTHLPVDWAGLIKLLPDEQGALTIATMGPQPEGAVEPRRLQLNLGRKEYPTLLSAGNEDVARELPRLAVRWASLGRPRRRWTWVYPVAFLLGIAAVLGPILWLWIDGRLSLWLLPFVLVVTALTFAVGSPAVQKRVALHRERRSGLDINFRLIEQVRHEKAARWLAIWSGVGGAAAGAIATLVAAWLTLRK